VKYLEKLTDEQRRENLKAKIKEMRLLDDNFMTRYFQENIGCAEFVLRIIMDIPDLIVKSAISQYSVKNLQGRSAELDIFAVDSKGKVYNIEVERSDKGAKPKRARYNSSLIDSNSILPGDDVELLPESYVIMITENDFWGKGKPIYRINKFVDDTGIIFNDGSHILYVNGEYKDDSSKLSPLGKLIHDFNCRKPDDMYYPILADKARYFKETEKGLSEMCKVVEDLVEEAVAEAVEEAKIEEKKETAIKSIKIGLSPKKVAEITGLSLAEVKKLQKAILVEA
jgi:hypothetical protein